MTVHAFRGWHVAVAVLAGCLLLPVCGARADELELINGVKYQGRLVKETPDALFFAVESKDSNGTNQFPIKNIRSIVVAGQQRILNPSGGAANPGLAGGATTAPASTRTRAEVEALIKQAGETQPPWWAATPLNYPKTVDLTWKDNPDGTWDPSRNLGQYLWSVINENPGKWKEGVRLFHYVLVVNKDDPQRLAQTMEALGTMYHNLLQDWARAAFWWRKAGGQNQLGLAHCYWKLGSREMAVEIIGRVSRDSTRNGNVIKLWADMGELDKALKLAEVSAGAGWAGAAYLAAGDACRSAGRYSQALGYYQKVLAVTGQGDAQRNKDRAQASTDAIRAYQTLDPKSIADGVYRSSSIGYAGPISVEVPIKAGRIESVKVTKHQEKQFYSALEDTPRQIVDKQSVNGIDAVTGATITSEAILNATAKALADGMKK